MGKKIFTILSSKFLSILTNVRCLVFFVCTFLYIHTLFVRAAKALTRLRICAGQSKPLLNVTKPHILVQTFSVTLSSRESYLNTMWDALRENPYLPYIGFANAQICVCDHSLASAIVFRWQIYLLGPKFPKPMKLSICMIYCGTYYNLQRTTITNFVAFSKLTNKAWYFMIYHTFFLLKIRKDVAKNCRLLQSWLSL